MAAALVKLFMSDVVLTFGVVLVVVIDDGSTFKGLFVAMCKALHINY